jgi:hypothetical protein
MVAANPSLPVDAHNVLEKIARTGPVCKIQFSRLLKNAHLPFDRLTALSFAEGLRCARHSSLRRTKQYASFLILLRALHPCFHRDGVCAFLNSL